ncbi:MAG: 4'-phosphopantetheinyl transferase superfamily protein [Deltaproteobacteria bacterium]|nr:4'-phosphopantetheinyl transferase superfamily protein [Deltaproteobacteria bacterium]
MINIDSEIHLYITKPEEVETSDLRKYKDLLSSDEIERHDRFKFDNLKNNFLITRALVRTTLANYLGCDPKSLKFETNSYGKPSLRGISFNLSHTDGLIVLAITGSKKIGVDTENLNRNITDIDIAKRYFAEPEYHEIKACSEIDRKYKFLEFWTLKESYIKAVGKGLSIPLDKFYFKIKGDEIKIHTKEDSLSWQFKMSKINDSHLIALAFEGAEMPDIRTYQTIPMVKIL